MFHPGLHTIPQGHSPVGCRCLALDRLAGPAAWLHSGLGSGSELLGHSRASPRGQRCSRRALAAGRGGWPRCAPLSRQLSSHCLARRTLVLQPPLRSQRSAGCAGAQRACRRFRLRALHTRCRIFWSQCVAERQAVGARQAVHCSPLAIRALYNAAGAAQLLRLVRQLKVCALGDLQGFRGPRGSRSGRGSQALTAALLVGKQAVERLADRGCVLHGTIGRCYQR